GIALVAIGGLRLMQADTFDFGDAHTSARGKMLHRSKRALDYVLSLEGIEAETRTEGQLYLAQVVFSLGDAGKAQQLALQTLEDARRFELTWLIARSQRVLGSIFVGQDQREEAVQYFEQARRMFSKAGMRLELARTMREYGEVLLKWYEGDASRKGEQEYRRGLDYVRESVKIFRECGAELDLKLAERVMERYKVTEKA
ncbi:MAG: tetratricopeptide repeat protein, partial [Ktedonobacteraceae bacterium]|nr:tetratricopeptide repeat protein [Ktedonobacteraceae bacterium]